MDQRGASCGGTVSSKLRRCFRNQYRRYLPDYLCRCFCGADYPYRPAGRFSGRNEAQLYPEFGLLPSFCRCHVLYGRSTNGEHFRLLAAPVLCGYSFHGCCLHIANCGTEAFRACSRIAHYEHGIGGGSAQRLPDLARTHDRHGTTRLRIGIFRCDYLSNSNKKAGLMIQSCFFNFSILLEKSAQSNCRSSGA